MNSKEKAHAVRAAEAFIESVAAMVGGTENERADTIAGFPEPQGLGTDGTCWSNEEHRKHCLAVVLHAAGLLKRMSRCERLQQEGDEHDAK